MTSYPSENQNRVYFVNTSDPPLYTKHICYFTRGDGTEFELCEVVEEYFPHPDAPDDATIQCLNIYNRDKRKLVDCRSGPLIQSWGSENTLKQLYPVSCHSHKVAKDDPTANTLHPEFYGDEKIVNTIKELARVSNTSEAEVIRCSINLYAYAVEEAIKGNPAPPPFSNLL